MAVLIPLAHVVADVDPVVLVPLALAALVYAAGLTRRRRRAGDGRRAVAFALALGVLAVALASPLEPLAAELFSAHMAQHLLLMVVAAPLLALAAPWPVLLAGLPRRVARALSRVRRPALRLTGRVNVAILAAVALTAHLVTLVAFHLPGPYEAALRSGVLHAGEHAALLAGALALWVVVAGAGRPRRAGHGTALLALLGAAIGGTVLGALLTVAPEPWYDIHAPGAHGLTALEDQQLAGLVMWIPGGAAYVLAAVLVVAGWLRAAERRAAAGGALALVLTVFIAGCGGDEFAKPPAEVPAGEPARGMQAIGDYGCATCHTIPGIDGADGKVGPPLTDFGQRSYIAGNLPNTGDNLTRWISDPQDVEPGTAMPDLGVPSAVARDIAAYLFTLQ
ncbi:MAG: cytochrome c oxidase assembly protein [Actinobacteria bacterium]|nr:cytochrome c oxidase assembly protein [Actinomycetota bacterium]